MCIPVCMNLLGFQANKYSEKMLDIQIIVGFIPCLASGYNRMTLNTCSEMGLGLSNLKKPKPCRMHDESYHRQQGAQQTNRYKGF